MGNQIFITAYLVLAILLSIFVLWKISKKQKLKRRNFKTAFLVVGIAFAVGFAIQSIYKLITFPPFIKLLIGVFMFVLTPFLIKKFYELDWGKAIKVYLLYFLYMLIISFVMGVVIGFLTVITAPHSKFKPLSILSEDIENCALMNISSNQRDCYLSILARTRNGTVCEYADDDWKEICYQHAKKYR